MQHLRREVERVQFLPAQSVQSHEISGAICKVVKNTTTIAKLIFRGRILGPAVVKLLVWAQSISVPATNTIFARRRRIFDFRVVLEACAVAELLVVPVLANWKDVVLPQTPRP